MIIVIFVGKISMIQLIMDQETGRSKGYGFITYGEAEDAKKALEQVNLFFFLKIILIASKLESRKFGSIP